MSLISDPIAQCQTKHGSAFAASFVLTLSDGSCTVSYKQDEALPCGLTILQPLPTLETL